MNTVSNGLITHARLNRRKKDRVSFAMREAASNAANYGATLMQSAIIQTEDGEEFLFCAHNGTSFGSTEEMASKGLAAHQTGEIGASLNGVGLHSSALSLAGTKWCKTAKLVIASKIDGEWHAVVGRGDENGGRRVWLSRGSEEAESRHMLDILKRMTQESETSNRILDENNVVYMFAIGTSATRGINSTKADKLLDVPSTNFLVQSDPTLFGNVQLQLSENVINPQATNERNRSLGTVMHGGDNFAAGSGSQKHYAATPQEFDDRYRDDKLWEIDIESFELKIRGQNVVIEESRVIVRTYPGSIKESNGGWHSNVRDGLTIRGDAFKKDGGSISGRAPEYGVYLRVPAIFNRGQQDAHRRFESSAVWFDKIGTHSQDLFGLNINNNKSFEDEREGFRNRKPYILVDIMVDKIGEIADADETNENPESLEILSFFHEEPDFLFDSDISKQVSKAIMVEAKKNLPTELMELLRERFPQPEPRFISLWGGGERSTGKPPKHPCIVYSINEDGTFEKFNKELHLGDRRRLAIFDPKTNNFVSTGLDWKPGITRGVQNLELVGRRMLSHGENVAVRLLAGEKGIDHERVAVFQLDVPERVYLETEDGRRDITDSLADDYVHGAVSSPTRNLVCQSPGNPNTTIGYIAEIPKRPSGSRENTTVTGNGRGSGSGTGTGGSAQNDYIYRHPMAIGRWKNTGVSEHEGGIFQLNGDNELVKEMFFIEDNPRLEEKVRELYFMVNAAVQSIYVMSATFEVSSQVPEDFLTDDEGNDLYDDDWRDYLANKQAEEILTSAAGQKLREEAQQHRTETAEAEVEADAVQAA